MRSARGLTQKEAASLMGVADATLSDYEQGVTQPRAEFLTRFAQEFGTTPAWLLTGEASVSPEEEDDGTTTTTPGAATVSARVIFFCDSCNERVARDADYCSHCGAGLDWDGIEAKMKDAIEG